MADVAGCHRLPDAHFEAPDSWIGDLRVFS